MGEGSKKSVEPAPAPAKAEAKADNPAPSGNKIFTDDAAAAARALLKSKLNQINSGIDPEILQAGITLAALVATRDAVEQAREAL